MRMMAQAWPSLEVIGQHGVDQLPWGHVRILLDRFHQAIRQLLSHFDKRFQLMGQDWNILA